MSRGSRILILFSSFLLIGVFFFPIWKIDLQAPQYPEGIGLRIWVNQISGFKEFDLKNINGLNHYIGMKEIEPESIPELKIMPYIIAGFILLGIIAALLKNKKIVFAWIVMILITFSVGLYDYYMWGYDYGHNLNPTAAIRVPGLTYQPPLIGSKQLLNMRATSMPDIGTYIIIFSLLIFAVVLYLEKKSKKV